MLFRSNATNALNTLKADYETFKQTSTDDITTLKSNVSTLRSDVTAMQTSINTITEKTASLDTTVTSIQNSFNTLETSFENVKQTVQDLVDKVNNLGDIYLKLDGTSTPTANITMGSHKVTDVATPTENADATNKEYVDGKVDGIIKKVDGLDSNYLRLDGKNSPTENIDWSNKSIFNFGTFKSTLEYNSGLKLSNIGIRISKTNEYDDKDLYAKLYSYSDEGRLSISKLTSSGGSCGFTLTPRKNKGMGVSYYEYSSTGTLSTSMGMITNLKAPVDDYDATNKQYVDSLAPTAMTDTEVKEITNLFA